MKLTLTSNKTLREFELNQYVFAPDFRPTSKEKWTSGFVVSRNGLLHYKIDIGNGFTWKRHVNQLRTAGIETNSTDMSLVQPPIPPLPFRDTTNGQTCKKACQIRWK